ncbi:hypothetical protein HWV62_21292 [Athelia sp. TMB]|nr:hypothetical protein HWV62_21292 [Athelia sp. TMB]
MPRAAKIEDKTKLCNAPHCTSTNLFDQHGLKNHDTESHAKMQDVPFLTAGQIRGYVTLNRDESSFLDDCPGCGEEFGKRRRSAVMKHFKELTWISFHGHPLEEIPSSNAITILVEAARDVTSAYQIGPEGATMYDQESYDDREFSNDPEPHNDQEPYNDIERGCSPGIDTTPQDSRDDAIPNPRALEHGTMVPDPEPPGGTVQSEGDEVMRTHTFASQDVLTSLLQFSAAPEEGAIAATPDGDDVSDADQVLQPMQKLKSFTCRHKCHINGKSRYLKTRWILDAESNMYQCVCLEQVSDLPHARQHLSMLSLKEITGKHAQRHWNPLIGMKV